MDTIEVKRAKEREYTKRRTATGYDKKWYQENKEFFREYRKKYREKNRERLNAYEKKWKRKHADAQKEYQRKYREKRADFNREYQREYNEKHRHPCVDCGTLVGRNATRCRVCNNKYLLLNGLRVWHRGKDHWGWKGGRIIRPDGYIEVLNHEHKEHNRNGYVLEHILVWESANKKPLPKGWIVHHLNGVKNDNRIKNLVALPSQKHYLVLAAKAKRIQELEALLNGQHQLL